MIKKFIFSIALLSLCACAMGPQKQVIDPSINPADRHIWVPADEEDLENRRLRQAELDGIANEIETLFLRFETVISSESNLRESTKDFIPEIGSFASDVSAQIEKERKRREALGEELAGVRSSKEQIDKQVAKLNEVKPVIVFSRKNYITAFHHFRKGQYKKSALLFKKSLQQNPPHSLIDNILFGLGISYFKMNKFPETIRSLKRVIEEYPRSDKWFMSHVMLGLTHDKNAEKSQALYILEKALKNNPPHTIRSMIDKIINLVHAEFIDVTS